MKGTQSIPRTSKSHHLSSGSGMLRDGVCEVVAVTVKVRVVVADGERLGVADMLSLRVADGVKEAERVGVPLPLRVEDEEAVAVAVSVRVADIFSCPRQGKQGVRVCAGVCTCANFLVGARGRCQMQSGWGAPCL
eukprot:Rhum_TRINITY_DN14548_c11_g2::Rhum_TRINITY_DN14548_c11_g2_i1::g.97398::m.97398